MRTFLSDFLANALATGLGAAIGIPIALWIARVLERREERTRKARILSLLAKELEQNVHSMSEWAMSPSKPKDTAILHAQLKDQLWRAFSDGGELQWIKDPNVLAVLAHCYHLIAAARYLSDRHCETIEKATTVVSFLDPDPLLRVLDDIVSSFGGAAGGFMGLADRSLGDESNV